MRLFWKVFLSVFIVISLSFSLSGTWMIQAAFHSAYNREIEIRNTENEMYTTTFQSMLEAVPVSYLKLHPSAIENVAQSLKDRMTDSKVRIWGSNKKLLFTMGKEEEIPKLIDQVEEGQRGYQVFLEEGRYKLRVVNAVKLSSMQKIYYVETISDIHDIYEQRQTMIRTYQMIVLILFAVTGIVSMLLSYMLTFRIRKLSKATRSFADGAYDCRADIKGSDEIGMLARDFNEMADNLNDKMQELTQQAKNQEAFTSAFAHELKTPLTAIIGYADMIRSMELTQEEKQKAAEYVYSQGKRLESLSFKLMELFVLRKQSLVNRMIDAQYLLQSVFDLTEVAILEKNMTLKRDVAPGKIYGEKDLLISLFANLTDNARKASEKGDVIWIRGRALEDGYEVRILDEGKGMPQEEVAHITQAFYMIDKSRSRKEGGAGLGMTLCSEIIKLHHAKWQIESEEGKGTTVTVWLPMPEKEKLQEIEEDI